MRYDFAGSPCARRVRIVLLEKGLDWVSRVSDGTAVRADGAELLAPQLYRRRPYVVGERLSIADVGRPFGRSVGVRPAPR